jgi:hypothetical protein
MNEEKAQLVALAAFTHLQDVQDLIGNPPVSYEVIGSPESLVTDSPLKLKGASWIEKGVRLPFKRELATGTEFQRFLDDVNRRGWVCEWDENSTTRTVTAIFFPLGANTDEVVEFLCRWIPKPTCRGMDDLLNLI